MPTIILVILWLVVIAGIGYAALRSSRTRRVRERLHEEHRVAFESLSPVPDAEMPWLRRWLFISGFRRPSAPAVFILLAVSAVVIGFLVAWTIQESAAMAELRSMLGTLPADLGTLLVPVLIIAPWIFFVIIAWWPWMTVRASRRRIVRQVEEDLPITLQILATLARAGLGLDAAILRALESSNPERVLAQEIQTFRRENLAGISRVQCWRRLAQRLDVPSVNIFVAAMVHAEQVGGGISNVLEHQAQDVQGYRRERALIQAQGLPVKMVFPLVICFLPGIFVWTLGPAFYQFLQIFDNMLRNTQ